MTDEAKLKRVAAAFVAKYPEPFHFKVDDFRSDGGKALMFEIRMIKAFGFGGGEKFSQTRWRFQDT